MVGNSPSVKKDGITVKKDGLLVDGIAAILGTVKSGDNGGQV